MKPTDLFHSGIVVEDFDGTLAWYTERLGYRWCEPANGETAIVTAAGEQVIPMHLAFSLDEPRLEVIEAVPGTLWMPADSGIHHLGFWSDDADGDAARLVAGGMTLDATGLFPDGSVMWAYCSAPGRPRTELVSRAMRASMNGWMNGLR